MVGWVGSKFNCLQLARITVKAMPGKITVDWNKCSGAGMCAQVCPMSVWDLEKTPEYDNEDKGHPNRPEDCIQCMACVNTCPTQAIIVEDSATGEAIKLGKK